MSELNDALQAAAENPRFIWPWQTCRICHLLTVLPEEDASAMRTALEANVISHIEMSRIIKEVKGLDISHESVGRHRRGVCRSKS